MFGIAELSYKSLCISLWLCAEGVLQGKLSGIFWIGPFLAIAGGLCLASDWTFKARYHCEARRRRPGTGAGTRCAVLA